MNLRWHGRGRLRLVATAGVLAALAMASPAAAQTAGTAAAGWPQFQGNASHTGYEQAEKSVTRLNVHELSTAWTQALPGTSVWSQAVVSAGTAYVIAADEVFAFNAVTGAPAWTTAMPTGLLGTPSVQGNLVLVAYNDPRDRIKGYVVALDVATGATVWTKEVGRLNPTGLTRGTTVTTTANRAYVSLLSNQVAALDLTGGGLLWKSVVLPTGSPACILSPPSVSAGFVVVGGGGIEVTALSASDGAVAWTDTLGTQCGLSAQNWLPAISDGTVYAGWFGGIAAIDLDSGLVGWDNQSVGSAFFPLSVTRNAVIGAPVSSGGNRELMALSRSGGTVLWQSTTKLGESMGATFGGLTWAMAGKNRTSKAVAFNTGTGSRVYSTATFFDDTQGFAPVVDAGRVYVNTGAELMCLVLPA